MRNIVFVLGLLSLLCVPVSGYTAWAGEHEYEVYDENGEVVMSGVTPFTITKIDVDSSYLLICVDMGWCKVYEVPSGDILVREQNIDLVYPYVVKHAFGKDYYLYKLDNSISVQEDELKRYILDAIVMYIKTGDEELKKEILERISAYISG